MDLRPWNYWTRDRNPYPKTKKVMRTLEYVMDRNPNHPGAIHLYIHTVEYGRPELAQAGAERLGKLAPGAGHLVHMPSHIFRRVGRYAEASKSNQDAIAADKSMDGFRVTFSRNGAKAILDIAVEVLAGEMAAKRKDYNAAIALLHRAVLLEDNLIYNAPPDWHVPVRQSLGAVLLAAGRPAEAEAIYWQDLQRNPENGWSLFGLMQSLRAQGKAERLPAIEARFLKAWSRADVSLTASRFMDDGRTAVAITGSGGAGVSP